MHTKTYFSGTVEAAVALARRELGGDALLINVQAAVDLPGTYEVTFGVEPQIAPPMAADDLASFLASRDVSPDLIKKVKRSIQTPEATDADVLQVLEGTMQAAGPAPSARTVAFVGPPGSGKTASVFKVAVSFAQSGRPVKILSLRGKHPGGDRRLISLASIAGIPFREVTASEMDALDDTVTYLIDTPGLAPADAVFGRDCASIVRKISGVEVHLVVTATTRSADLALTADRFQMFEPRRLLFTRFDEISTAGGIASLCHATGLPISWLGVGQAAASDLEAPNIRRIAEAVLAPPQFQAASRAATAGGLQ